MINFNLHGYAEAIRLNQNPTFVYVLTLNTTWKVTGRVDILITWEIDGKAIRRSW